MPATTPRTETVSIGLSREELATVKARAEACHLSASRLVATLALRQVAPEADATTRAWLDKVRLTRASRDHRVSAVIRCQDMDVVRAAARRVGASPHAWLQAVAVVGVPTMRVEAPGSLTGQPAADRQALDLLAGTLAALLIDYTPSRAVTLGDRMRELAGLDGEAVLTGPAIRRAALSRFLTPPREGNVVELRPPSGNQARLKTFDSVEAEGAELAAQAEPVAAHPGFHVSGGVVSDLAGNQARLKTFDSVEACKLALQSCIDCYECVDCVDCRHCTSCTTCGQCRDCRECVGCIAQVGKVGANGLTIATT